MRPLTGLGSKSLAGASSMMWHDLQMLLVTPKSPISASNCIHLCLFEWHFASYRCCGSSPLFDACSRCSLYCPGLCEFGASRCTEGSTLLCPQDLTLRWWERAVRSSHNPRHKVVDTVTEAPTSWPVSRGRGPRWVCAVSSTPTILLAGYQGAGGWGRRHLYEQTSQDHVTYTSWFKRPTSPEMPSLQPHCTWSVLPKRTKLWPSLSPTGSKEGMTFTSLLNHTSFIKMVSFSTRHLRHKVYFVVLPLRINHGFLKPRFQAAGALVEWFLSHFYIPVSYKEAEISGTEKGGQNQTEVQPQQCKDKNPCEWVGINKRQKCRDWIIGAKRPPRSHMSWELQTMNRPTVEGSQVLELIHWGESHLLTHPFLLPPYPFLLTCWPLSHIYMGKRKNQSPKSINLLP